MFFNENTHTFTRNGVQSKIVSETEQKLLSNYSLKNNLIVAWSIKESTYKIMCKEGHKDGFSPRIINIIEFSEHTKQNNYSGEVTALGNKYFFHSEITIEYVFSWASNNLENLNQVKNKFLSNKASNYNSKQNKSFLEYLNKNNWVLEHNIDGIPFIKKRQNKMDISITHDMRLMAISEFHINT